jgi:uncharacterized protein YajQ (UPF0234 family)
MTNNEISIILTCTVDVNGVEQMARVDLKSRLEDYKISLASWLNNPDVNNIIFIENSGFDLSEFKEISNKIKHEKSIEFISIHENNYPRHLGKGYGEFIALNAILEKSSQLKITKRFIKVTGRYYIKNIKEIIRGFNQDVGIYCGLSRGLTFSDTRVFGADVNFLKNYLCVYGTKINDSRGWYIEHALAESFLKAVSDGVKWSFIKNTPVIVGYYGTLNIKYKDNFLKRWVKNILEIFKEYLIKK